MAEHLIAHIGHTTKGCEHILWWKPCSRGYTVCIDKAGRYNEDEASRICATGENIAVPWASVPQLAWSTPYYRRSNGTLAKLYDGGPHRPVPNSREAWGWLMNARILQHVKPQKPTPIGAKARAIYLPPTTSREGE
jgi:hypothetical protein